LKEFPFEDEDDFLLDVLEVLSEIFQQGTATIFGE
jgi:hypothetical protein